MQPVTVRYYLQAIP